MIHHLQERLDKVISGFLSRNLAVRKKSVDIFKILKEKNIGQLIVTDQGKYFGIVDLHKLLDEGIN